MTSKPKATPKPSDLDAGTVLLACTAVGASLGVLLYVSGTRRVIRPLRR